VLSSREGEGRSAGKEGEGGLATLFHPVDVAQTEEEKEKPGRGKKGERLIVLFFN